MQGRLRDSGPRCPCLRPVSALLVRGFHRWCHCREQSKTTDDGGLFSLFPRPGGDARRQGIVQCLNYLISGKTLRTLKVTTLKLGKLRLINYVLINEQDGENVRICHVPSVSPTNMASPARFLTPNYDAKTDTQTPARNGEKRYGPPGPPPRVENISTPVRRCAHHMTLSSAERGSSWDEGDAGEGEISSCWRERCLGSLS